MRVLLGTAAFALLLSATGACGSSPAGGSTATGGGSSSRASAPASSSTSTTASSTGGQVCAPGQQNACACPGQGDVGAQVCNADGSGWGPCMGCGSSSSGTASSTSSSSSAGAGGSGVGGAASASTGAGGAAGTGGGVSAHCTSPATIQDCGKCSHQGECISCAAMVDQAGVNDYNDLLACAFCNACYTTCDGAAATSGCAATFDGGAPTEDATCDTGTPGMSTCTACQMCVTKAGGACFAALTACEGVQQCVDLLQNLGAVCGGLPP